MPDSTSFADFSVSLATNEALVTLPDKTHRRPSPSRFSKAQLHRFRAPIGLSFERPDEESRTVASTHT
jgi:hypothetical protein